MGAEVQKGAIQVGALPSMVFDMLDEGPEANAQHAHTGRHEGSVDHRVAHDPEKEVFAKEVIVDRAIVRQLGSDDTRDGAAAMEIVEIRDERAVVD